MHKHGDGRSLDELKKKFPKYVLMEEKEPASSTVPTNSLKLRSHSHLTVTTDDLSMFSSSIISFWEDVPSEFLDVENQQLPKWFRDAL